MSAFQNFIFFLKRPSFSLCLATARPDLAATVVSRWERAAWDTDIEFIVCVDEAQASETGYLQYMPEGKYTKLIIQRKAPFNCVHAWNTAAAASRGKVLILISDDFYPPYGWDVSLKSLKGGEWMNEEKVVLVSDGPHDSEVCTLPILTRARYKKIGYALYPQYESMFSDTDLTHHAEYVNVLLRAKHLVFRHGHPDGSGRNRDDVDLKHASIERYDRGQRLFNLRARCGFAPLEKITTLQRSELEPDKQIARVDFTACFLVNRDDFCLKESCEALIKQGVDKFCFAVPSHNWYGTLTPQKDIDSIYAIEQSLEKDHDVLVETVLFDVLKYRDTSRPMRDFEGATRNEILRYLWNRGREHVLIIDGDELWVPGAVGMVANVVETMGEHCDSVNVACIPVIGLPGYPVENARDSVCVYVRKGHGIASARSPVVNDPRRFLTIHQRLVYHFTATRRTREEIVEKHLLSNHSDDPNYNMHDWIRDILPNIKPGLRDAHMYKQYSLWPVVRDWIPGEKDMLPKTLIPYLGLEPDEVSGTFTGCVSGKGDFKKPVLSGKFTGCTGGAISTV